MAALLLLDLGSNYSVVLWKNVDTGVSERMWSDHIDELEALQAIYGDKFTFLAAQHVPLVQNCLEMPQVINFETLRMDEPTSPDWSITCRILVDVPLSEPLRVEIISDGGGTIRAGIVEYIPPVEILFTIAEGPSVIECFVSACWIDLEQRKELEETINTLCMDLDGQPAIFSCCEHIKYSLQDLESLSFAATSSNEIIRVLLQYNIDAKQKIFIEGLHACVICYEDVIGSRCYKLGCGHVYCCDCLKEKLRIDITEGCLDAIRCPNMECKTFMEPHEIKDILGANAELFDRWETLTLKRALDTMPDASYCPRCSSLALEDVSENTADCPKCFFVFCTLCEEARHPGLECVGPETKLEILRRKAQGGGQAAVHELRRKEQEYKSLIEIQKTSKPCPSCGIAIQRTEGCNKMTCSSCGAFFCWACNADISDCGYDHFKDGGTCVLFDEREILRWERQWGMQVGLQQAAIIHQDFIGEFRINHREDEPQIRANITNCPNCGQVNHKMGRNNHIHCWSCTKYYCALCRLLLQRRGGTHFSRDGCPQHS